MYFKGRPWAVFVFVGGLTSAIQIITTQAHHQRTAYVGTKRYALAAALGGGRHHAGILRRDCAMGLRVRA